MPHNVFDMSNLYKFKSHIQLDKASYLNTAVRSYGSANELDNEGKKVIGYMTDEAFINGYQRPSLKLPFGVDIDGRNCSYDPYLHYSYSCQTHRTSSYVLVYVLETPLQKARMKRKPNYLMGSIKTNLTVSSCRNIDFFTNGTYLFSCPVLEDNPTIAITATYVSTATSVFKCESTPLWTLQKFQLKLRTDVRIMANSMCSSSKDHEAGFWLKVGGQYHWAAKNCYYPYHFDQRQRECLSNKSVIMFGDSHTTTRLCLKHAYKLDRIVQYQTIEALNLLVNLFKVYKKCLIGKCVDVLVSNVAHHDLREQDIIAYIAGMSDIFRMFERFKKLNNPPQIIWVETMPVAENGFHGAMMTNQAVEALNDWVDFSLKGVGVEILYAYKITITMTSQTRDGSHFHCFLGQHIKRQKVNVVGAAVSVMVNMMCPLTGVDTNMSASGITGPVHKSVDPE